MVSLATRESDTYVNKEIKIVHLTSERGQQLNGRVGNVIGWQPFQGYQGPDSRPERRYYVRVTGEPKILRLKPINVRCMSFVPVISRFLNERDPWVITNEDMVSILQSAVIGKTNGVLGAHSTRRDSKYRAKLMVKYMLQLRHGSNIDEIACKELGCGDINHAELDRHQQMLTLMKFSCHGDGKVCFKRFTRGLKNDAEGHKKLLARCKEFLVAGMCEVCQFCTFEHPQTRLRDSISSLQGEEASHVHFDIENSRVDVS